MDNQFVIMSVIVLVGAFSKNSFVLSRVPIGTMQAMRRIKMSFSRDRNAH
jgi:hypothetical protein